MVHFIGNCRTCGYPLAKLPLPRCPECGTPFDPEKPETMDFQPSRVIHFLSKKTTLWTVFPAFLACGSVWAARAANNPLLLNVTAILAVPICAATVYLLMARYRFQSWLKRRAHLRARELKAATPDKS